MCLVVYNTKLPPRYYQAVISCLNSAEAQSEKEFASALEKVQLEDGRNLAKVLHTEGHLKKVPCNQVFACPYGPKSSNKIKLNELNEYTKKIEEGGEALKKLEEFDENKGYKGKKQKQNEKTSNIPIPVSPKPQLPSFNTVNENKEFQNNPKVISDDLKSNGELLKVAALQLLQQAKILAEKAESIYPSAPKRGRGRPKGSITKLKSN